MSSVPESNPIPYRNHILEIEQDHIDTALGLGNGKFIAIVSCAVIVAAGLAVLLAVV